MGRSKRLNNIARRVALSRVPSTAQWCAKGEPVMGQDFNISLTVNVECEDGTKHTYDTRILTDEEVHGLMEAVEQELDKPKENQYETNSQG